MDEVTRLHANNFWDATSNGLNPATNVQIQQSITGMDPQLRNSALTDDGLRAQQLQWALYAANQLTNPQVALIVPVATYDFSNLYLPHRSADANHDPFCPKLFIARNNLAIQGPNHSAQLPRLSYAGPGKDGVHHGRVLIMAPSGLLGVSIRNLHLQGDHSPQNLSDTDYYLHENTTVLLDTTKNGPSLYGILMVGLMGGSNGVTISDCRIDGTNWRSIQLVGNATIADTMLKGIIPTINSTNFDADLRTIRQSISEAMGGPSFGEAWQEGVDQQYLYGPTVIRNCALSHFIEGIDGQAGISTPWTVSSNRFDSIFDHGIYILGNPIDHSYFSYNTFNKQGSFAIKLGGHTTTPSTDPLHPPFGGAHASTISNNSFRLIRQGAILLSGVENSIYDNTVTPYDAADDPDGFYNPTALNGPDDVYPEFWLSTAGGQACYACHTACNTITNNSKGKSTLSILIEQSPDLLDPAWLDNHCLGPVPDRSIEQNAVNGAGQTVYFHHLLPAYTQYSPAISVSNGASLVVGAPANCADSYPSDHRYITALP